MKVKGGEGGHGRSAWVTTLSPPHQGRHRAYEAGTLTSPFEDKKMEAQRV